MRQYAKMAKGGDKVSAAGFDIIENLFQDGETFRVRSGTTVLANFDVSSLGSPETMFLGMISTTEFNELFFDEAPGTDDIAVGNFAMVPEPATASLMALVGGLGFLIRRHLMS